MKWPYLRSHGGQGMEKFGFGHARLTWCSFALMLATVGCTEGRQFIGGLPVSYRVSH